MPDRILGDACEIRADFPLPGRLVADVSVTDPFGQVVLSEIDVLADEMARHVVPVPAGTFTVPGAYQAVWTRADGMTVAQTFTVGPRPNPAITRFQLRAQLMQRVGKVWYGTVTGGDEESLVDDTLRGGDDDYLGWWVVIGPPHPTAGHMYRVIEFFGTTSGLGLHRAWPERIPPVGANYILSELDPREADRAIEGACQAIGPLARVRVTYDYEVPSERIVRIPDGWTHVLSVSSEGQSLPRGEWTLLTGRRLAILSTTRAKPGEIVTVTGLMTQLPPVWEDSLIDLSVPVLLSQAVQLLHASRAGGAATDPDEHLRRQLTAIDEYDRVVRWGARRVPNGAVRVLE
jgi:hypothetical protein